MPTNRTSLAEKKRLPPVFDTSTTDGLTITPAPRRGDQQGVLQSLPGRFENVGNFATQTADGLFSRSATPVGHSRPTGAASGSTPTWRFGDRVTGRKRDGAERRS